MRPWANWIRCILKVHWQVIKINIAHIECCSTMHPFFSLWSCGVCCQWEFWSCCSKSK
jgi:hypothetical protein